jgi:hypothetical protein
MHYNVDFRDFNRTGLNVKIINIFLWGIVAAMALGAVFALLPPGSPPARNLMDRRVAMDVTQDLETKFSAEFIVGKTTYVEIEKQMDAWRTKGANVFHDPIGAGAHWRILCQWNGGENDYSLTLAFDTRGKLKSKSKALRHLGF